MRSSCGAVGSRKYRTTITGLLVIAKKTVSSFIFPCFFLVSICGFAAPLLPVEAFIITNSRCESNIISRISRQNLLLRMSPQDHGSTCALPALELPEPICSNTPNTWAYDTMSRRVDAEILHRTDEDNKETFDTAEFKEISARFQELRKELQSASTTELQYLNDLDKDSYEDADKSEREIEWKEWKELLQPYVENKDTWLTAPWMVTEFYVYRRLIQAIGYFDIRSPGYQYDPFKKQKDSGLFTSVASAEAMLGKIIDLPETLAAKDGLPLAIDIALWGNKMDLSIWPADAKSANKDIFSKILSSAKENLLHDDSLLLVDHCEKLRIEKGGGNVHIIVDNAGFELVTDLALAQYLIQSGIAKTVTFQLKSHPTFVSDAMEKDLLETIDYYATKVDPKQYPNAQKAGMIWKQLIQKKQWICHEHRFWVQPYAMWEMTEPLRTNMANECDLAFVKGDANYRRLLGDRVWDYSAPFEDVVGAYFPCPVCALRTLKAEIGCGMDSAQVERAQNLDKNWMVNGRFGVIHFGKGATQN